MSAVNPVAGNSTDSWSRVSTVVELADIFDPAVQVCSWQRSPDTNITAHATDAAARCNLTMMEVLRAGDRPQLLDLPTDEGGELLRCDVAMLAEILCELVDYPSVGCTGALFLLTIAARFDIYFIDIVATLSMGLGCTRHKFKLNPVRTVQSRLVTQVTNEPKHGTRCITCLASAGVTLCDTRCFAMSTFCQDDFK